MRGSVVGAGVEIECGDVIAEWVEVVIRGKLVLCVIEGVGGGERVIGVWGETGDAGEEGLVEVGVACDVRSGWKLMVPSRGLEAVQEEV